MTEEELTQIKQTVKEAIDLNVNGKINLLTQEFRDYVKIDTDWKTEYEPYLKALSGLAISGKILAWIAVAISAVSGAFVIIKSYLK